MSLSIYTSEACNLACKYCFLKKNPRDADWRTLKAIIDWWFRNNTKRSHLHIFGTEPLYRFDHLQNVYRYAEKLAKEQGKTITKGITTNGVGLTEKVAKWLTEHKISCLCSIDGMRSQHNKWRVFPNGSGSWDIVSSNFQRWAKMNPSTEAAMTVTPDSIPKLAENVDAIFKLGFWAVALNKVVDSGPTYSHKDIADLEMAFKRVNDLVVSYAKRRIKKHIMFISNFLLKRAQKRSFKNITTSCGAAKGSLATDIDGRIYICHRAIFDYGTFGVGDVWNGIDMRKIQVWRNRRNIHCQHCTMVECSPCYVVNLVKNGDIMKTPWEQCAFNHLVNKASFDLESQLKREGLYSWYVGRRRTSPNRCTPILDEKARVIGKIVPRRLKS